MLYMQESVTIFEVYIIHMWQLKREIRTNNCLCVVQLWDSFDCLNLQQENYRTWQKLAKKLDPSGLWKYSAKCKLLRHLLVDILVWYKAELDVLNAQFIFLILFFSSLIISCYILLVYLTQGLKSSIRYFLAMCHIPASPMLSVILTCGFRL